MFNTIKRNLLSVLLILAILMIPMSTFALDSGIYTVQQKSSNRYMDAYQSNGCVCDMAVCICGLSPSKISTKHDFNVVTFGFQNNDTQKWLFLMIPGTNNRFTIQQLSNLRYLDAYESNNADYRVVTRPEEPNHSSQQWIVTKLNYYLEPTYRIQQVVNQQFLDAYEDYSNNFTVVTRNYQSDTTQEWYINE